MGVCHCLCHQEYRGNQREANHAGRFMEAFTWAQHAAKYTPVSDSDPVSAAQACPLCVNQHCAALRTPRGPTIPLWQADGYTDSSPYKDEGTGS